MKKLLLFLLVLSTSLIAQEKVKVDLSSPNSTIYTHLYFLQPDSYEPDKAAKVIYGYESDEAQKIAIKIKQILDGKGLRVDFSKVPKDVNYSDTIGAKAVNRYVLFPYQMPQVYVEQIGNKWYYSRETVNNIDEIYNSVYPWFSEKLQQIIPKIGHERFLKIELWQFLGMLILIVIGTLLFYLLHKVVYYLLKKIQFWIIHKSNHKINSALKKLSRPIVLLVLMGFIKIMLPSLLLHLDVNAYLFLGLDIMTTVFWIYVFLSYYQPDLILFIGVVFKSLC